MTRHGDTPEQIRRDQEAWARRRQQARDTPPSPTAAAPDYRQEMRSLAGANQQLQRHTDHLNDQLRWVNAQLREMDLGVSVWLPAPIWTTAHGVQWHLGYARASGVWQLAVHSVLPSGVGKAAVAPAPLVSAPRAVRLYAAPAVKQLLLLLTERVHGFAADVAQASAALPATET